MSPLLAVLKEMRGRLGMYLGTSSLTKLAAFLRGYEHACYKLGAGQRDEFLSSFRDWIQNRFGSKASWEEAIQSQSANEAGALTHFWELLDEYLEKNQDPGCSTFPVATDGIALAVPRGD